MSGGKVVDRDHRLIKAQESLEQMRSDESRTAGHEPDQWLVDQPPAHFFDCAHRTIPHNRHKMVPESSNSVGSNWLLTSAMTPLGCSLAR